MILRISYTGRVSPLFPGSASGSTTAWGRGWGARAPDDDDDAVEDVVGVAQVVEEPEGGQLQEHLQGKHAGEDHVADLQDVGQLLGLRGIGAATGAQSGRREPAGSARGPQGGGRAVSVLELLYTMALRTW